MVFGRRVHARNYAHAQESGTARQCRSRVQETGSGKAVADYRDFALRQTFLHQTIGGSTRIANDCVAAAKHRKLRTEFRFAEQIAELTLAANYHGNTGQSRRWNQREIGIEIKGMRNRRVVSPQMPGQTKTRLHRLQIVETAFEWEFCHIAKAILKRALPLNAAELKSE